MTIQYGGLRSPQDNLALMPWTGDHLIEYGFASKIASQSDWGGRDGNSKVVALLFAMFTAQIYEWPHPCLDEDWAAGKLEWREITPLAYRELKAASVLLHEARSAFMQAELVDILADGEGLHVCCKREFSRYFARLLPAEDWWKRDYLPLPETGALH